MRTVLSEHESVVWELLAKKRVLKKRSAHSHVRTVRAVTAKLEHEYEARVKAGAFDGTFLEWMKSLPWAEIWKIVVKIVELFP